MAKPYIGNESAEYNNRITIEVNTPIADASGQLKAAWSTLFRRWSVIQPRTGKEQWKFAQVSSAVDYLVYLRFDSDSKTLRAAIHRVNWSGTILNIVSIIDVNSRGIEFELHCTSVEGAT